MTAIAAGLLAKVARASGETWPEAAGIVAQAECLRDRATPLAEADAEQYEAALRASDGFLLWRYIPQIPSTQLFPILADNILLLALQDGSIDALRASSGILLWHYPVNSWHL